MPSPDIITPARLARRIRLPGVPILMDVRAPEDFATDLSLAPEAAGLLAASLGLSRMHRDDLVQLEAGITLYDAFFRWCRDAAQESHNWPTGRPA